MAKISKTWSTRENRWYDELKSIAPYLERQYEKIILSNLNTLFPDFYAVNYKRNIKAIGTAKASKPDFALIRKDFGEWWIVEVETIEDNLTHVKQQIENFTGGLYSAREEANYIYQLNKNLDLKKLQLMTRSNPKVLVLVDDIDSTWIKELIPFNPSICVFKIYRSSNGFELLNISGDYPYIYEAESFCHLGNPYRNLMSLSNPNVLLPKMHHRLTNLEKITKFIKEKFGKSNSAVASYSILISFRGQITEWKRVDENGEVYLQPVGPHGLRINDSYVLRRTTRYGYIIDIP